MFLGPAPPDVHTMGTSASGRQPRSRPGHFRDLEALQVHLLGGQPGHLGNTSHDMKQPSSSKSTGSASCRGAGPSPMPPQRSQQPAAEPDLPISTPAGRAKSSPKDLNAAFFPACEKVLARNQNEEDFRAPQRHESRAKEESLGKATELEGGREVPSKSHQNGAKCDSQADAGLSLGHPSSPKLCGPQQGGVGREGKRTAEVKQGSNGTQNHM